MNILFPAAMKKVLEDIEEKIMKEFYHLVKEEVVPKVVNNLMDAYNEKLLSGASRGVTGLDEANPNRAVFPFYKSITKSIDETMKAGVEAGRKNVSFRTGNMSELGYDKKDDIPGYLEDLKGAKNLAPLDWLIFYLEGFIGEYAFISMSRFKEFVDAGAIPLERLLKFQTFGWYGKGFMIPKEIYEKGLAEFVPFENVRHPFSGMHPSNLFDRAMDGIDIKSVMKRAIKNVLGK